ncbi:MAG: glycosyltransferase [Geminicoccaceae bacterium]
MSPIIREQLGHLSPKPSLSATDWHDCIDPAKWHLERSDFCSSRPVIGASGQPTEDAWPNHANAILSLYPDDPQFLVKIFNGGPILKKQIESYPRNWETSTFEEQSERAFLSSIDFFVYGHHPDGIAPISQSLLRAMASGAVAILPPLFARVFGDGAIYAEPHQVKSTVWKLYSNRRLYMDTSERGMRVIAEKFSSQSLVRSIGNLIGNPDPASRSGLSQLPGISVRPSRGRRRAMFITINGVGMGHLTRMLAIAKRCPKPIEPVFVTMSQALKVLREQGYLSEFIPSRQYLDCDINHWNAFLRDELNEMISFYDPAVVVFDGNVPYQGLIDAIQANPDPWFIWSRRGMWRSDNTDIVGREKHFDAVLEPGDLAAVDDHGITTRYRNRTHHVRPIRLLDTCEMLSRDDARSELGLDTVRPAILIQLGAGNNFDYRSIHNTALAHIKKRHDAQIAVGEWLISDQPIDLPETVVRMPGYPFARYFKAFDLAISAVGYNSFHELLFAGVPTILVPNEAMEQDNQLSRALYADRHGLAVCVRTREIYRLTATIDRLLGSDEQVRIKRNLAALDPANGATEAALLIDEMAYSQRIDQP